MPSEGIQSIGKDRYDIAFARDTDHDRHGIVTRCAGLLPPNHYRAVAIDYLFQNRPRWNTDAALGKTVVSSTMIDRVTARLGRNLYEVPVGRVKLYLLDCNDAANYPAHRGITSELYGDGPELRLKQELVLGLGGWRLLRALGLQPEVCHLNEGHAAFAVLERARNFMEEAGHPFDVALAVRRAGNLFTTHTAVAAGFDRFAPALIEQYLGGYAGKLDLTLRDLLALGRQNPDDPSESFSMAYLAIRGSGAVNGVSRLHGQVSQHLFEPLFLHWPAAGHLFDPNALTLGFARRFATYKRPNMLLHNPERLLRLLTHPQRPVQLILAGKAHPADQAGQALIRQWTQFIQRPEARRHVIFLSDYNMLLSEYLVQGVDVWINTPRRPWEACGTSGMKVLVNGGINLSELDGWWAEAYTPEVGWALGDGHDHGDDPAWDAVEAVARQEMKGVRQLAGASGGYVYSAAVPADRPPAGDTVRVIPHCDGVAIPLEDARILWQ